MLLLLNGDQFFIVPSFFVHMACFLLNRCHALMVIEPAVLEQVVNSYLIILFVVLLPLTHVELLEVRISISKRFIVVGYDILKRPLLRH